MGAACKSHPVNTAQFDGNQESAESAKPTKKEQSLETFPNADQTVPNGNQAKPKSGDQTDAVKSQTNQQTKPNPQTQNPPNTGGFPGQPPQMQQFMSAAGMPGQSPFNQTFPQAFNAQAPVGTPRLQQQPTTSAKIQGAVVNYMLNKYTSQHQSTPGQRKKSKRMKKLHNRIVKHAKQRLKEQSSPEEAGQEENVQVPEIECGDKLDGLKETIQEDCCCCCCGEQEFNCDSVLQCLATCFECVVNCDQCCAETCGCCDCCNNLCSSCCDCLKGFCCCGCD